MSGKYFVDSNIVLYVYSEDEPQKKAVALDLLSGEVTISTQVLSETINVLRKKFKFGLDEVKNVINELTTNIESVETINKQTILDALDISKRYKIGYYDSLIVSSAIESGCEVLYSEDMSNGLSVQDKIVIINPFEKGKNG